MLANAVRLAQLAALLRVPTFATEQNPSKLGASVPQLAAALQPHQPKPDDWHKWMWKFIGWGGAGMFGLRWLVQFWATKKAGKPTIPLSFWGISVCGALMTLSYFVFYKNDSVGIISNALPSVVAAYNLRLALKHRKEHPADADLDTAVVDREEADLAEAEKDAKKP